MKLASIVSRRLLAFGATGVLLNCFALGMNMLLVEGLRLEPAPAYAVVLLVVALAGFALNRTFVFLGPKRTKSSALPWYVGAFLLFRLSEWLLFTSLVYLLGFHYLLGQILNMFLFFFIKFLCYQRILLSRQTAAV
jgi:putative flippase GtrA